MVLIEGTYIRICSCLSNNLFLRYWTYVSRKYFLAKRKQLPLIPIYYHKVNRLSGWFAVRGWRNVIIKYNCIDYLIISSYLVSFALVARSVPRRLSIYFTEFGFFWIFLSNLRVILSIRYCK